MKLWIKRAMMIGLAVITLILIIYAFWPKPLIVELATVTRGALEVTLEQEGKTRVVERMILDAPFAAVAGSITLRPGAVVDEGQELVQLRPLQSALLDPQSRAAAESRLDAAQDAWALAKANVDRAAVTATASQRDLERSQELAATGVTSKQELERAETTARAQRAELNAARAAERIAKHEIDAAKAALGVISQTNKNMIKLSSPIKGVVLRVNHEHEGVVTAGTPLIEIGDPRNLEIIVDVLSRDALLLRPGMPAMIEIAGLDQEQKGQIRTIEPAAFTRLSTLGIEEQRVNIIVDFAYDGELSQLGDAFQIDVRFILWSGDDVLQVSAGAVFRREENWYVFVEQSGRAVLKAVEIGQRSQFSVEIKSGLSEGEKVVVFPGASIEDNVPISSKPTE